MFKYFKNEINVVKKKYLILSMKLGNWNNLLPNKKINKDYDSSLEWIYKF